MAASYPVNNIAATFSASSAARSSSSSPPPTTISWNPHSSLPSRTRSSLLRHYGLPGPLRGPILSTPRHRGPHTTPPPPAAISLGSRLPNSPLSYLDRHGSLHRTSLHDLTRGKKAVILSASAAFAPPPLSGSAHLLARRASLMRSMGAGAVACVAANDVYVMKAWGESLGADEEGLMMLSDPDAELAAAMGTAADMRGGAEGLGVRSESFCMVALDGVVTALFLDERLDFDGVVRAL